MTTRIPRVFSDMPIPPGETLQEELEARGMTQKDLAARLNRPAQVVNEIISGKKAISRDTAIGLEKVLGIDAQFWTNLEANYRVVLAMNRDRDALTAKLKWLDEYPIKHMLKRGWIEAGPDKRSRLDALLRFLEVTSAEPKVYHQAVGLRITDATTSNVSPGALAVWLRKGELDAQEIHTADYNEEAFRQSLVTIREMMSQRPEEFVPAMTARCAETGVAFCMVQELPKSGANGATRWLTNRKALIQMSIRHKWADIFWFSFFHEAGHLIKHRTQRQIAIDGLDAYTDSEMEAEADQFARDFLVPPSEWSDFCNEGRFTPKHVREFAQSVGVAPFIVVGRLQKEGKIRYNQLTDLKRRYKWIADSRD